MRRAIQTGVADRAARAAPWLAMILLAGQAPPAAGQCRYEVTWVGPIQGPFQLVWGEPTGLNNRGQIVGYFVIGEGERGFVWSQEDGLTLLPMPPGAYAVSPADINDAGQIVGTVNSAGWAFLWDPEDEEYTALGIPSGGTYSNAYAINEQGQVVGVWGNNISGPNHGFLWEDGVMTDLGPMLGTEDSNAADIAEDSAIAGAMGSSPVADFRAFVLRPHLPLLAPPLPPGAETSVASAISESGILTGDGGARDAEGRRFFRGFVWISGVFQVIEPLDGFRNSSTDGVNARGEVIGRSSLNNSRGFIWRDGVRTELSSLVPEDHQVRHVAAIDEHGRIAAHVYAPPLGRGAALVTPITTPADLNIDCRVDLQDLLLLLLDFGCAGGDCDGDVNQDGQTSLPDLAILLTDWNP